MIRPGHLTGVVVWRIAPCGTTAVMLDRILNEEEALVSGKGQRTRWAKRPSRVFLADLFPLRPLAQAEYRRRRTIAIAAEPNAYRNFASDTADQWATP